MIDRFVVSAAIVGTALLAGCGSSDDADVAEAVSPAVAAGFDVNDASEAEITAVLERAGIANAETWAHEIEEYRPYDGTAADWDRLREELTKYGADDADIDTIIDTIDDSVGGATFSVNDASEAEITAVLERAGIANAETWAHEIEEYRPYDGTAADWDRLREELTKYGADDADIDTIIDAIDSDN